MYKAFPLRLGSYTAQRTAYTGAYTEGWFMALQASRDIDKSEPFHCELVEQPLKPLLIYMSAPCIACVYCVFSI